MDFELSEEQQMFRDVLRQFVNTEIKPVAREMEQSGPVPPRDRGQDGRHGPVRHHRRRRIRWARPRLGVDEPGVRGDLDGLDGHSRHPGQPLAELPDDHPARHRGAEAALAARAGHRAAPHRHRPHRARRGQRPAGHLHQGVARRRRICDPRDQDLDHQRPLRQPATGSGEDRPRRRAPPPGHERADGGGGHPRLRGAAGPGQAGIQGPGVVRGGARRRAGARGQPARRPGGPGVQAGHVGAGGRPHQHSGSGRGGGPRPLSTPRWRTPSSARPSASP